MRWPCHPNRRRSLDNHTMSAPREGPNPLRPYYIPPSVGSPPNINTNASPAPNISSKHASASSKTNSFGSSARNILADMDYSDYLSSSSPSAKEVVKQLAEQAVWKYTSVFLAQPFEVAKTVLQVHVANSGPKLLEQAQVTERMQRRPDAYRDRDDLYDVRSALLLQRPPLTSLHSYQTTPTMSLNPTSHPRHHFHTLLLDPLDRVDGSILQTLLIPRQTRLEPHQQPLDPLPIPSSSNLHPH